MSAPGALRYPCADPHILAALDPGKRVCGVAVWDGATRGLLRAAEVKSNHHKGCPRAMCAAVVAYVGDHDVPVLWAAEQPRPGTCLEAVMWVVRRSVRVVAEYPTSAWKSDLPKGVHQGRFKHALTETELRRRGWKRWGHNAWDAVGIGLYALGRTDDTGRSLRALSLD